MTNFPRNLCGCSLERTPHVHEEEVNTSTENEDCMPNEDENVLFFAFRYALGRRTAAVSILVVAIQNKWSVIPFHTKEQMKREIREAIESKRAGDDCDVAQWVKVLNLEMTL